MARRGENIWKRNDGRWEGRYIKGRTPEGKAHWGYVYASTYSEVRKKTIQKRAEYSFYNLTESNLTFSEIAELWLNSVRSGVKESTHSHYQYTLHRYLFPVFGEIRVAALDEKTLENGFLDVMRPKNGEHKPLGAALAQECLSMLRRICSYAVHLRMLRPLDISIKLPQKQNNAAAPLTIDEQKNLKAFVLDSPTPRKIGLLLGTQLGLRIGEICGLQWGDFDLLDGVVTICRTVSRISCGNGHTKLVIQSPKTQTSARKIPLPKAIVSVLKRIRGTAGDNTWFLSGNEEKPVEPRCYRKSIHVYLKKAAVHSVHPHMLRHTFATTCLQSGCDIKTLSELLGHANASITLKMYVHSDLQRKKKEINRIFRDL